MTDALADWWAGGARRTVGTYQLQVRKTGAGPAILLLHGFPCSSFEWAAIEATLAAEHTVITFDFLGYGASDKPPGHRYSVFEQADLTQALLSELAVDEVALVAYDYGAIVATELLAREDPRVKRCILMNAGIFADQYRPRLAQRLSLMPVAGAILAKVFNEKLFIKTWGEVYSAEHPLDPALAHLHYRALRHNDAGGDIQRHLLRYIPERAAHNERLQGAVLSTAVPLHFLWGMADPVSGRPIADEIKRRMPDADLIEYRAGHCPHIELPKTVAEGILARTASA